MNAFQDFIGWAGSQRAAADAIGLHESTVSLIANGKRELQPAHAVAIERASAGFYRCEQLLPALQFIRDADGQPVAYQVRLEAAND